MNTAQTSENVFTYTYKAILFLAFEIFARYLTSIMLNSELDMNHCCIAGAWRFWKKPLIFILFISFLCFIQRSGH